MLSGLGNAGQLDDVVAAHDKGDYAQVFKLLQPMAMQGDADAQFLLGVMYTNGKEGVAQDYKQAANWFRKAATQGDAGAQCNLGVMYFEGKGVPQDYERAHMWLNLAAAQGDSVAVKNRDLAAKIMTAAADCGSTENGEGM